MDQNSDVVAMLCRRIKMARIEKNLSQIELAKLAQVGIATIKRIELGESITLLTLISVLRGLGELDQLNNLLVHNELKLNITKDSQQRKRKITKPEPELENATNNISDNDFIVSLVNNMCWKH